MNKLLKVSLLAAVALAVSACDSSGSSAADAAAAPGATAEASATDWTTVVSATEDGGYRMGNPDARVKLVEFGSYTCSHCGDFYKDAVAHLEPEYVKTGKVSYEFRPFMLNIYDFAATKLAMCQGTERFFNWTNELYGNQEGWIEPFTKITEAEVAPLRSLPLGQQVRGLALAGQLNVFAARRGLPTAEFDKCLADEEQMESLANLQQKAVETYRIEGTPTFLLNGKKVDNATTWAQLKPKIDEAL